VGNDKTVTDWLSLAEAAAPSALGAPDVLVFRRLAPGRYAHLGGTGRGEGWAGIVEVALDAEPLLRAATESNRPVRHSSVQPARVIGPYWAKDAVLVAVSPDVVVVMGDQTGSRSLQLAPDVAVLAAGRQAASEIQAVPATKRLADELEVLHAVQQMMQAISWEYDATLRHVAMTAAESLSCELGVLVTSDRHIAIAARDVTTPDRDQVRAALLPLLASVTEPVCVQAAELAPLPEPLSPADGVLSYYLVPMAEPAGGLLLLAHTVRMPRGFTSLCQRLGVQLAEAAAGLIHVARLRHQAEEELVQLGRTARRDAVTGVANRMAWDEALREAQHRVDHGEPVTVITLDLDGLKQVNDSDGHAAGDQLLATCAGVLGAAVRDHDLVARIGGDEFGVLLPGTDEEAAGAVVERIQAALLAEQSSGMALSASMGWATCLAGATVVEALGHADRAMYDDKRRRRAVG
jgi:diguanylate cyclase (GGDEF)-like protein